MTARRAARMPALVYGTAWKKERSRDLVRQAILAGFRGVDTAAQPKHYQEDLVGLGIRDGMQAVGIERVDFYVQTKFTSVHGQDPTKTPYDPNSSITDQVHASVASSLEHLKPTTEPSQEPAYIDCLVLHSPFPSQHQREEAWRAMQSHVPHSVRTLGISNVYLVPTLQALYGFATVKPVVVQNRFYRDTRYDQDIRAFCAEKGIVWQSFWTLSANPYLLKSEAVTLVAEKVGVSLPVALYGLVLGLGEVSVLDGTTNTEHMRDDLDGVQKMQDWQRAELEQWAEVQEAFAIMLSI